MYPVIKKRKNPEKKHQNHHAKDQRGKDGGKITHGIT
jgi:hypothetical protein